MKVWLIQTGEPLPFLSGVRKMRTALLADELCRRGHQVTWWASSFNHQTKQSLCRDDAVKEIAPNYQVRMPYVFPYQRNFSLRRLMHYKALAKKMHGMAQACDPPDLILASLPDYDTAHAAYRLGRELGVPLVVDIRDPWPDSFTDRMPGPARGAARLLLRRDRAKVARTLAGARALLAMSQGMMDWGLARAGRPASNWDRIIHLGYPRPRPQERQEAAPELLSLLAKLRGKTVFSFVGIFGKTYDLELVVEAARRLPAEVASRVAIVLAGDGQKASYLRKQALALPMVHFTGWLDSAGLQALLSASDVGLATFSIDDSGLLPNKIFEYLAYGLPLLASSSRDIQSLIDRHAIGLSYPVGDVEGLVSQVSRFTDTPGLISQMSGNAKKAFAAHFEAERVYKGYADHLELIAGG